MKKLMLIVIMLLMVSLLGCGKTEEQKKAMLVDSQKAYETCVWNCAIARGNMFGVDSCSNRCDSQKAEREIMIKGM